MYHVFFIHSSVEGRLCYFQFLAITSKAVMNIVEHMSLWDVGESFGYMSRNDITVSSGRTIPSFLRKHQTVFPWSCTSLHSHQHRRSVPLAPHPPHCEILILAILMGVRLHTCVDMLVQFLPRTGSHCVNTYRCLKRVEKCNGNMTAETWGAVCMHIYVCKGMVAVVM